MSFLAPLFLVGALAVAAPIIFHLIRRTSREKMTFSSLMFLVTTPPRVTRRSRLENIFLLVLRCLVLCLLALGFARPFLQHAFPADPNKGPGRKIVILLDASASMKRGGLWAEARARAEEALRKVSPADQVALFTFDRQVNRLLTFDEWSKMGASERVPSANQRLAQVTPRWASTHLGGALIAAAEAIEEGADKTQQASGRRQIVLISDLQEGSRLDALQAFEWPKGIELQIEPIKAKRPTNAGLQLVTDTDDTDKKTADTGPRVRVSNSSDSKREQFQVGWARAGEKGFAGPAVEVYVPPGQSRVVTVPPLPPAQAGADRLVLQGDDEDFDNTVYLVPPEAARVNILFLGNESEKDSTQSLYFLQRAFQQTRRQNVQISPRPDAAPLLQTDIDGATLLIVTDALAEERLQAVRRAMTDGKTVLLAMKNTATAPTLARLLDTGSVPAVEFSGDGYSMLALIDFQHPLLAPFADPRFSDFTKIHFWKHRRVETANLPGTRVLARFDNGDAALLEGSVGKGRLFVLTSGWQPADSQFALSSKFVPLLYSMLELSGAVITPLTQQYVGDSVPLASLIGATNQTVTIRKPDGTTVELAKSETAFAQTDQPGIYTLPASRKQFAVNLDAAESKTAPLSFDELERLGLPLKHQTADMAKLAAQKAHLQNAELENRQKLWRWLIVTALLVLLAETWLAGRLTQRATAA
jgi:hypothetical protein